jgi:4-hydroxyphenylpyruvate dioxygenase-like putative hemolysin
VSAHDAAGSEPVVIAAAAPLLERVDQLCILVESIEEAIASYSDLFAVTRWRVYRYGPDTVPELGYRGGPGVFSMWVALSDSVPQIELIESISGPSLYTEWIAQHGFGFHHVGVFTASIASSVKALTERGLQVSQWGRGYGLDGDGGFAYVDSLEQLGVVLELIEIPKRRRPPDREWVPAR